MSLKSCMWLPTPLGKQACCLKTAVVRFPNAVAKLFVTVVTVGSALRVQQKETVCVPSLELSPMNDHLTKVNLLVVWPSGCDFSCLPIFAMMWLQLVSSQ